MPFNALASSSTARRLGRRPASAARRADRSRQLIDAALDCIATLGLRDTTVQDLAARAGMAVGSISQYFEAKETLYTAALTTLAEEFEATWRRAVEEAGTDPAARLRAFVDVYFDPKTADKSKIAVWFAFWGEVRARPQYRAVCEGYDAAHDAALNALVTDLLVASRRDAAQAPALAKLIASGCHGLWLEWLTGTERLGRSALRALAHRQLAMLFPTHADAFSAS
jgi:TetR/AcrR family transcriptional regulator, transcriptional repressor of bet genes